MNLDEILNGVEDKFHVSAVLFQQLKAEALKKADDKSFGYTVVVVDFADPQNVYSKNLYSWINSFKSRNVLWFHEHAEQATPGMLQVARAHVSVQMPGYEGHKFITAFDSSLLNQSQVGSFYSTIWGRTYRVEFEEYILHKKQELTTKIESLLSHPTQERYILNVVGERGSGKTTLLLGIAGKRGRDAEGKDFSSVYTTMENYVHDLDLPPERIVAQIGDGRLLLLDETNLMPLALHELLRRRQYDVVVYASQTKLPTEFGIDEVFQIEKVV